MEWIAWVMLAPLAVLLGHGAWIVVARIFGYRVKTTREKTTRTNPPATAAPGPGDWLVTMKRLASLVQSGTLDSETYSRVMAAIQSASGTTRQGGGAYSWPASGVMPSPNAHAGPPPVLHQPPPLPPARVVVAETTEPAMVIEEIPETAAAEPIPVLPYIAHEAPPLAAASVAAVPPALPYQRPVVAATAASSRKKPAPPRAPRRTLAEMLASFMEENNIRWGELVGGLLIVGCSVALVLSFWSDITRRAWLQFSVFTAVTAAFFGLGLYTEHRWKLPTTSRGILLIATLLVPLNFLAFAAFSGGVLPGALTLGAEIVAFALFAWLVWHSGRVIASAWPEIFTAGVCVLAALLLSLGCIDLSHAAPARFFLLASLPLLAYGGFSLWMLLRARRWRSIHAPAANSIFLLLGVFSFPTALAMGLCIYRSPDVAAALCRLSLPLGLGGLPALAAGMLLWQRIGGRKLATYRTAGTVLAIAGAGILLSGIALAWPDAGSMLPIALCDFLVLTLLALYYEVPAAHWLALPCLMVAWLAGFSVLHGDASANATPLQMAHAFVSPLSATTLTPLALLLAMAWEVLARRNRPRHSRIYGWVGLIVAACSLAGVTWGVCSTGINSPWATSVYAIDAAVAFALAWRCNRAIFGLAGWLLLSAAMVRLFVAHQFGSVPMVLGLLAAATLAALADAIAHRFGPKAIRLYAGPPRWLAVVAALGAVTLVLLKFTYGAAGAVALDVAWAAAVLLFVAIIEEWLPLLLAGQTALGGALVLVVISPLAAHAWFGQSAFPLLDAWTIQTQAVALTALCILLKVLRHLLKWWGPIPRHIAFISGAPPSPELLRAWDSNRARLVRVVLRSHGFDITLAVLLLFTLCGLATLAIAPACMREFSTPGAAPALSVFQTHATGGGSWLLLLLLVLRFAMSWRKDWSGDLRGPAASYSQAGQQARRVEPVESIVSGAVGAPGEKPVVLWSRGGWSTPHAATLFAMMTTLAVACPLLAARMAEQGASASALRWLSAAYLLIGSMLLWRSERSKKDLPTRHRSSTQEISRTLLVLYGAGTVLGLSVWATIALSANDGVSGLSAQSIFARMGLPLSYSVPLLVIAVVALCEAVRQQSQQLAFVASCQLCLTGTLVYLITRTAPQHVISGIDVVRLLQINALLMAGSAILWLALREALSLVGFVAGHLPPVLAVQATIGLSLNAIILFPAAICLAIAPTWAVQFITAAGGLWGWAALIVAVAAAILSGALQRNRLTVRTVATAALALAVMLGLSAATFFPRNGWLAFHAMLSADAAVAWALLALGWAIVRRESQNPLLSSNAIGTFNAPPALAPELSPSGNAGFSQNPPTSPAQPAAPAPVLSYQQAPRFVHQPLVFFGGEALQPAIIRWAFAIGMLVVALAVRALLDDPGAPWWSMAAVLAISLLAVSIACWALRPGFIYPAGMLLNLAAASWYLCQTRTGWTAHGFFSFQIIAAALPAIAWLVLELKVFRPALGRDRRYWLAYHNIVAVICIVLVALQTAGVVAGRWEYFFASPRLMLIAMALLAEIALLVACRFDPGATYAAFGMYVLGLCAIAQGLNASHLSSDMLYWVGMTCLAGYTLLTGLLYAQGDRLRSVSVGMGLPMHTTRTTAWLPAANVLAGAAVFFAAVLADFSMLAFRLRIIATTAALSQSIAIALLARGRAVSLRKLAIATFALGAVLWGWAWLDGWQVNALYRSGIAFVTLAIVALLQSRLPRFIGDGANPWPGAARSMLPTVITAAAIALAGTLALEIVDRANESALPSHAFSLAVLAAIVGACVVSLLTALRPKLMGTNDASPGTTDEFSLSHSRRVAFVYGAEALLAIAFVHLRLAEPHLFGGALRPYWPLVVMAIAFAGVGAAEVFRRQGNRVLSEPLERTGIFMPLLPVIGWWLAPAAHVNFAELLLIVGAFYATLAALRQSLILAAVAVLAGNGALWDLLAHSSGLGFFRHPQLWLIPASLSALAGAHLNRTRLGSARLRDIRYVCLLLIYVSSSADVFLNGVNRAPWLPLVLAALSVGGVLYGVMCRIRPFLFLGMGFLLLSIISMIWFASARLNWTWIWYVAGILLGTGILALFALFEKKRSEMLALLEGLKQWE